MEDEDAQVGRSRELLLDPAVAAAADLAVVEVGLARVDRDDRRRGRREHRVPVAEELLEVDVADVARVVVAGDHDHRLALDPVQVVARERVLVLEAVRGEVAGDHDDVRLELVHLGDRALEVLRQEELLPAVQVRELHDPEHRRRRPTYWLGAIRAIPSRKPLDHRVHLLGHLELVEMPGADRDPDLQVRLDLAQPERIAARAECRAEQQGRDGAETRTRPARSSR